MLSKHILLGSRRPSQQALHLPESFLVLTFSANPVTSYLYNTMVLSHTGFEKASRLHFIHMEIKNNR